MKGKVKKVKKFEMKKKKDIEKQISGSGLKIDFPQKLESAR